MAHFCLLVATPTQEDARAALHPFWNDDRDGQQQSHFVFIEDRHADVDASAGKRGYWRNPQGKWDGWTFGGRFAGLLEGQDQRAAGDVRQALARNAKLLAPVHALLREGVWQEAAGDAAAWRAKVRSFIEATPVEWWISVVDCHC